MQDVDIGGERVKGVWDHPVHFFATFCEYVVISNVQS